MSSPKISLTAIVLLFWISGSSVVSGQDSYWLNAAGGDFHNSSNWNNGVPTGSGVGLFDLNNTYSVELSSDASFGTLRSLQGDVRFYGGNTLRTTLFRATNVYNHLTFDGAGTRYEARGSVRVVENGRLSILGGAEITSREGQIGSDSSTLARMTVSGPGSVWNSGSTLTVGPSSSDQAVLEILDGGTVNAGITRLGAASDSLGNLYLSGSGSVFNSNFRVTVGDVGSSQMYLNNGATSFADEMIISNSDQAVGGLVVFGEDSQATVQRSVTIGKAGTGSISVSRGGSFVADSVLVSSEENSSGVINVSRASDSGTRSSFQTQTLTLGSTNQGAIGSLHNHEHGVVITGNDSANRSSFGELTVGSRNQIAELTIQNGSDLSNSANFYIGKSSSFMGNVLVTGRNSVLQSTGPESYVGFFGTGSLNIEDQGVVENTNATIGQHTNSQGLVNVTGSGSRFVVQNDLRVSEFGKGTLNVENRGVVTSRNLFVGGFSGGEVNVTGLASKIDVSEDLLVQNGILNIGNSSQVEVGNSTQIDSQGSVKLSGGTFRFGLIDADSYSRISGSSGVLIGGIRADGYNEVGSFSGDYQIANLNTDRVGIGNAGVIHGSGYTSLGVYNSKEGEVRVLSNQWMRFGGSENYNLGQMNVLSDGILEFEGRVTNEGGRVNLLGGSLLATGAIVNGEGSRITGRGQISSRFNTVNSGSIAVSGGNMDILGSFQNINLGTVITSGNSTTTFFDHVTHNGAEIRTSEGSSTVFLGSFSGAGDFTGEGDVFFEGELRPGNSPDVISFAGNVSFSETTNTLIEIAGTEIGQFDRLEIGGNLHLDGLLAIDLIDEFQLGDGQEFVIMDVGGELSGSFIGLEEGDLVGVFDEQELYISYSAGDGNDVSVFTTAAVPEPSSILLLGFGSVLTLIRRRRKTV